MIVRNAFPKVYRLNDSKSGNPYWLVDARSKRWGMNERPTFGTEKEALDRARAIADQVAKFGAQPELPREAKVRADAYAKLVGCLAPFDKTPEDAVSFYVKFLGDETIRQAKPSVGQLVDQFQAHKLLEKIDDQYLNEIKVHCRFIKRIWGDEKIDEIRRNDIETKLTRRHPNKNTRRKYLTFAKMFFNWVLGEDRGYILTNPATGIKIKPDNPEKEFYPPETVKGLLRYVAKNQKELVGYYALLTFSGLRPSEGARVQWHHINFTTQELHVLKGKTDARHVHLEPVALEWLKWFRDNSPGEAPFVPQKNMFNLERKVRESMGGKWIPDGLRHGFATFYASLKKDFPAVAWYMGNSVAMIKKHYATTIPGDQLNQFWGLTPPVVLADESAGTPASQPPTGGGKCF